MIIHSEETTGVKVVGSDRIGIKGVKTAYGTEAERLAMPADVKAEFTAGSVYIETDTGKGFIFDENSNDFTEV